MLCKAAVMGDYYHYDAILASEYPADSKALGRGVAPWDQARSVSPSASSPASASAASISSSSAPPIIIGKNM